MVSSPQNKISTYVYVKNIFSVANKSTSSTLISSYDNAPVRASSATLNVPYSSKNQL